MLVRTPLVDEKGIKTGTFTYRWHYLTMMPGEEAQLSYMN